MDTETETDTDTDIAPAPRKGKGRTLGGDAWRLLHKCTDEECAEALDSGDFDEHAEELLAMAVRHAPGRVGIFRAFVRALGLRGERPSKRTADAPAPRPWNGRPAPKDG